jgi:hypothetical protein
MSLLENVAENFSAHFQDNDFRVNKLGQSAENNRIAATQKARQEMNCDGRREIGCCSY